MLVRIWKAVWVIFARIFLAQELLKLNMEETDEFFFLSGIDNKGLDATSLGYDATS